MDKLNVHNFFKEQDKEKRDKKLLEILLRLMTDSYPHSRTQKVRGKE